MNPETFLVHFTLFLSEFRESLRIHLSHLRKVFVWGKDYNGNVTQRPPPAKWKTTRSCQRCGFTCSCPIPLNFLPTTIKVPSLKWTETQKANGKLCVPCLCKHKFLHNELDFIQENTKTLPRFSIKIVQSKSFLPVMFLHLFPFWWIVIMALATAFISQNVLCSDGNFAISFFPHRTDQTAIHCRVLQRYIW